MELKLRRDYERPKMRVVEIRQRAMLMTSGLRSGYGTANTDIPSGNLDSDGLWNWD